MSVVSAKVDKRAVRRNRLRRQVAASFRELWPQVKPGWDLAVIIRHNTEEPTTADLQAQIERCLKRLRVLN